MPAEQVGRVVGMASSIPFDKNNPYNPVNRRISIIVMTKSAIEAMKVSEGSLAAENKPEKAKPAK